MRDRSFISAGESPRPFSDVVAERRGTDPAARSRDMVLARIAELEADAAETEDPVKSKALQCEAEGWRVTLDEGGPVRAAKEA